MRRDAGSGGRTRRKADAAGGRFVLAETARRALGNLRPAGFRSAGPIALAVLTGAVLLITFQQSRHSGNETTVRIGSHDVVAFSPPQTKENATALGEILKSAGIFADRGGRASLANGRAGPIISITVAEGAWDKPEFEERIEEVGRLAGLAIHRYPVKLRLRNSQNAVKRELIVGKIDVGSQDEVYYYGSATAAEATSLAKALHNEGYIRDQGVTVVLNKGRGTTLSFVVNPDARRGQEMVESFERLTRSVAGAVGGTPVKLRLVDSDARIWKETVIP